MFHGYLKFEFQFGQHVAEMIQTNFSLFFNLDSSDLNILIYFSRATQFDL